MNAQQAIDALYHVDGNAYRSGLVSYRPADCLAYPPCCVGREFIPPSPLEFIDRLHQTYVPLLNSVLRGEVAYEIGRKWNSIDPANVDRDTVGSLGDFAKGTIERDYLSYGITVDYPLRVPFYGERMEKWGVRPCWDTTFGVFGGYSADFRVREPVAYETVVLGSVPTTQAPGAISAIGIPMPPPPGMEEGYTGKIRITAGLLIGAFLIASITTSLAGLYPAWKASRKQIVNALRHNI